MIKKNLLYIILTTVLITGGNCARVYADTTEVSTQNESVEKAEEDVETEEDAEGEPKLESVTPEITQQPEKNEIIFHPNDAEVDGGVIKDETELVNPDLLKLVNEKAEWKNPAEAKTIVINIEETRRFEIIFTKGKKVNITAVSPSGQVYTSEKNVQGEEYTLRKNSIMVNYGDLEYHTIYLSAPGDWKLTIAADKVNELFIVDTSMAISWQTLKQEKMFYPNELMIWHVGENSAYKYEDIINIASAEPSYEKPEEEPAKTGKKIGIFVVLGLLLAGGGFLGVRNILHKKESERVKQVNKKHVEEAKKMIEEKKAKENEELARIIESNVDEYVYYPPEVDYTKWQPKNPNIAQKQFGRQTKKTESVEAGRTKAAQEEPVAAGGPVVNEPSAVRDVQKEEKLEHSPEVKLEKPEIKKKPEYTGEDSGVFF